MASIFSGPFLGVPSVRLTGKDYSANFAEGVAMRQRERQLAQSDERLRMEQQQEERLQAQAELQELINRQTIEMGKLKFEEAVRLRQQALDSQAAIPGLMDTLGRVTDWTDLGEVRKYAIQHPEVTFTPQWEEAMRKESAALNNAAYMQRVQEQVAGRIQTAEIGALSREAAAKLRATLSRVPQDPALKASIHLIDKANSEKLQAIYNQTTALLGRISMQEADRQAALAIEDANQQIETLLQKSGILKDLPQSEPTTQNSDELLQGLIPPSGPVFQPTTKSYIYQRGKGAVPVK